MKYPCRICKHNGDGSGDASCIDCTMSPAAKGNWEPKNDISLPSPEIDFMDTTPMPTTLDKLNATTEKIFAKIDEMVEVMKRLEHNNG